VSNTSSLEQRLARREAVEAIKKLKAAYIHACDNKQPEVVRECFFVGRIDLRYGRISDFTDREKVVSVFFELGCQEHIVEMPHGQNPRIVLLNADHANGVWGLYYYVIDTRRQAVPQLAGVYDDDYVRREGQWRIMRSYYTVTSSQIFDFTDGPLKVIYAEKAAPLELDDPCKQAGLQVAE